MLSTDTVPLTIGATPSEETAFAHAIADRLGEDITARLNPFVRLFARKLELYALAVGCHISDDRMRRSECRQSHVNLSQDDMARRETTRRIIDAALPAIITRYKVPFSTCSVEVVEVDVYQFDGSQDRYGMDFAIHIILSR